MKATMILSLATLLLFSGTAMAAKTIGNLIDVSVPAKIDGSTLSLEEVKNAIVAACKYKRWTPLIDEEGNLSCSILVRSEHYAEVSIPFTESKYSIMYKDSRELDYNEAKQRIHRNYNKWVILLSDAIQSEFTKAN